MKAVYKCPGQAPAVIDVANDLKALQGLVEGNIEVVRMAEDVVLIVNEEFLLSNMRFNCSFLDYLFFGPMLFVGVNGEEFRGLSDREAEFIMDYGGFYANWK